MTNKSSDELLTWLYNWLSKGYDKKTYDQIAAILKNQPTITKRDLEGWAEEALDKTSEIDFSYSVRLGNAEDVMKEMLTEIGVTITEGK